MKLKPAVDWDARLICFMLGAKIMPEFAWYFWFVAGLCFIEVIKTWLKPDT